MPQILRKFARDFESLKSCLSTYHSLPQYPGRDGKDTNFIPKILTRQWFFQLLVLKRRLCVCEKREWGDKERYLF